MKKLLLLLIPILLVFVGCNNQTVVSDEENVELEVEISDSLLEDYPFNSTTTVGDLEWIGRVIEAENGEEPPTYELVKVDKEGNETIMYESMLESLFPIISLKTSKDMAGSNLILEHIQGYPEGGVTTLVFYDEEEEIVRATAQSFWGFIQNTTFQYPDTPTYQISLETSDECSNYLDQMELTEDMETDILGIGITFEDDTELFELSSPKKVSCEFLDGYVIAPMLRDGDVQVYSLGVKVRLPGDIEAFIGRGETKELEVYYY